MSVCMTFHLHKTLRKAKQNRLWRTKRQNQTIIPNNLFVWINTITAKFDTLFHSFGLIFVDLIQFDACNRSGCFFLPMLSFIYCVFIIFGSNFWHLSWELIVKNRNKRKLCQNSKYQIMSGHEPRVLYQMQQWANY